MVGRASERPAILRSMGTTGTADLVLRGGRISTMDAGRRLSAAVAIRADRIVAVGSDDEIRPWIGPRTRVVELRGRTVTPGFGDAHTHPVQSGYGRMLCDLDGLRGLDAYLRAVSTYATTHPDADWIIGDGWLPADFPNGLPHRSDLDRILPGRPVFLRSNDGHLAWVNSAALAAAGISRDTSDPVGGRIDRDPDGSPSGALLDASSLVDAVAPAPTPEDLVTGLRLAQTELHALGITHWQDAIVEPFEAEIAYTAMVASGQLTARVVGALWWEPSRGDEQIDELVDRRRRTAGGRYAPTSVKLMLDGVVEGHTAALLEPYLDADGMPTGDRGVGLIEPEALGTHVAELDALGFQPHFHAIGERAVREALDAVERARRVNGPSDTRPHIAHIQIVHPADIDRFASLDVTANGQPLWACHEEQMDRLNIPVLGDERATWLYPFGSLLRSGARLALGSDWSVSSANPLLGMEVAVTRMEPGRVDVEPLVETERISLMDALAGYTIEAAWINHLDHEIGSIEVGKAADLVVLDRDLFDRGSGTIGDARVVATFIDGAAVHETTGLEG
jgi:predicted amidohydrolase YtcJ